MVKRLSGNLFELAVSVSWMLVGLSFLPSPTDVAEHSPVGRNVGAFLMVWAALLTLGGAMVAYSALKGMLRSRVAGHALLTTGLLMEGVAAATYAFEPRVLVYFVYGAACATRALLLTMEHRGGARCRRRG